MNINTSNILCKLIVSEQISYSFTELSETENLDEKLV